MRVSSVNNYNNNPAMLGYTYRPNRSSFYLNPIKLQVDNLFERSITASRSRIFKITKPLQPYLQEVPISNKKIDTYAYDISKNNGQGKYVLFLHGLGQNISALQDLYTAIITQTDYSVFAPEYRGFGKNKPAEISKDTFLEDTQAALDFLVNDKQIPPENICLVGHSFGGFAASQLAKKNSNIEKLILVASVDNLENEIMRSSAMKHVSKFAFSILKHIHFLRIYLKNIFSTKEQLETLSTPVDIIHSINDKVVNYSSAQYLAENCPNLHSINLIKTGGHSMESKKIEAVVSLLK